MWNHDWSAGSYIWMGLSMLLFLVLVAAATAALLRFGLGTGETRARHRSAEDVLAERFARGEIDADEYEQRSNTLRALDR
jgi:putative membrane protein